MDSNQQYWPTLPPSTLAPALEARVKAFYDDCVATGRSRLWASSTRAYYGLDSSGGWQSSSTVTYGGKAGEMVQLQCNHYRSLAQAVHSMVTGTRPALQCRAGADTFQSMENTVFAQSLLEFKVKESQLEDAWRQAAMYALFLGEGWTFLNWDVDKGDVIDADPVTKKRIYAGDVECYALPPHCVIRDPNLHATGDKHNWLIVQTTKNRWDLISRYPEFAKHLRGTTDRKADRLLFQRERMRGSVTVSEDKDQVETYEFFHRRTPSCPEGRRALMVGGKVLNSGDLPYTVLPVFSLFPDHELGSSFGYSPMFDLIGPQQAYNSAISVILSAHDALGMPNVWTRKGDQLSVKDLSGSLRHIQSDEMPQAVQLTAISQHTYEIEKLMAKLMETLCGVNSVVRGDPASNLKSGSSMALVHSQALQYNSGMHGAYMRMIERSASGMLQMLQTHVEVPQVAEISGEDRGTVAKTWTKTDIQGVGRVVVEVGSPLIQTAAGRKTLADEWSDRGWLQNPGQYAQVLSSGRAEPVYRRERDDMRLIASENELLRKGVMDVPVLDTDPHMTHFLENAVVLSDPEVRKNPAVVSATLTHLSGHIERLKYADPAILFAAGVDPAAIDMFKQWAASEVEPQDPMGGPPMDPMDPMAPPPMAGGEEPAMPAPMPQDLPPAGPGGAEMPDMPVNPATGEEYVPTL